MHLRRNPVGRCGQPLLPLLLSGAQQRCARLLGQRLALLIHLWDVWALLCRLQLLILILRGALAATVLCEAAAPHN